MKTTPLALPPAAVADGPAPARRRTRVRGMHEAAALAPGIALTLAIAVVATLAARLAPVVGPAVIAIVIGIAARVRFGLTARYRGGVAFSSKRLLQVAIVLLGAGLSLRQVWITGSQSLLVLLGTLIIGLLAILAIGSRLGIERTLTRLIAVGTAICGASAIGALAPVLEAESGAIAYAISTIFLFNVLAVLLFPPLGHLLGLSQRGFGLWAGTAVNDTSSVVAAAYSYGTSAGSYAVVVKLTRTVMIVPVSLCFAVLAARERRALPGQGGPARRAATLPLFLLWFLLASALNTLGVWAWLGHPALPALGQFLIVAALAGVGLSTDLAAMRRAGLRPIALGALGWACLASLSLVLQLCTHLG